MTNMETNILNLRGQLGVLRAAAERRVATEEAVTTLERDYEIWKLEATGQLVGTENALTSKPHSLTSAKDAIRETPDYHRWTAEVDRVRLAVLSARVDYEVELEQLRSDRAILATESDMAGAL